MCSRGFASLGTWLSLNEYSNTDVSRPGIVLSFSGIMDPGRSNHIFSKGGVPARSVTSLKKLKIWNGISDRRLACRSVYPQGPRIDSWTGPIGCPETSVWNYHFSLHSNSEESNSQLLRGGSLKSHMDSGCRYACTVHRVGRHWTLAAKMSELL